MRSLAYTRFELVRTFRNRRLLVFSLGFPLILFFLIAAPNRNEHNFNGSGISIPLYYMVGLVAFGAMSALISSGARIATERTDGWTRQLRITPLKPSAYFRAKVVTGYAMAAATIAVLYASGVSLGVSLGAGRWLEMTGLILVALVPFAALGILLGHLLTADSIGPAVGGLVSLLALVSGTWFPLGSHGFLHDIAQFLPSYWLVRASHVSLGGHAWTAGGWVVIAAWTAVLVILAHFAYQRDTARVTNTPIAIQRRAMNTDTLTTGGVRRWRLDPTGSTAEFQVPNLWGLVKVKGRFERLDGWLELGKQGERRLELTIDATSLTTGNAKRDEHLRSGDFFDTERHPTVRFVSTSVSDPVDGRVQVEGELLAAGHRVVLELDPTLRNNGDRLLLDASTTLDQRELGMTYSPLGMTRTPTASRFTRI